jgi:hypothetical protein
MDLVFNLQRVVINVLDKTAKRSDFWTRNNFLQKRYISHPTYEDDQSHALAGLRCAITDKGKYFVYLL